MRLYIDFTGGALGNKKTKYHGGGDFSRFITWKISEYIEDKKKNVQIVVIWPEKIEDDSLTDEEKLLRSTFNYIDIDNIADIKFAEDDLLFFPLLDVFSVSNIGRVRKNNEKLRIYGVLHGVRLLDSCKYDKYDKFYYSGIKSINCVLWSRRWCAGIIGRLKLKKYIPKADRVYTVSNNSMQRINQISKPKYIKFFTRNISDQFTLVPEYKKIEKVEHYILFVSSNRYEKNFIRSLIAFCRYQEKYNTELKLRVIGMSDELKKNLKKIKELNWDVINKKVIFESYVSDARLRVFYENCDFLLYTTKSEGYGLPPLEAMNAGRPTVASSTTSVPEVLGMGAYYVNPYSISDIISGIEFMQEERNQIQYVKRLSLLKDAIINRGDNDVHQLIEEILE